MPAQAGARMLDPAQMMRKAHSCTRTGDPKIILGHILLPPSLCASESAEPDDPGDAEESSLNPA